MKRLFFILTVVLAVVLTNCTKNEDLTIDSQSDSGMLKDQTGNFVPISGTITGVADAANVEGCLGNGYTMIGEGNVSHLGNTQVVLDFCSVIGSMTGSGVMEAANGDILTSYFTATYEIAGPFFNSSGLPYLVCTFTGTGTFNVDGLSTGRFEDAEGYFNASGTQIITDGYPFDFQYPLYDIQTTFTFEGMIDY